MAQYLSLIKNTNNETVFSPSVIAVGWGGCIEGGGKQLKINGEVNFRVLRTAFTRAKNLGIGSETVNGLQSIPVYSYANGISGGVGVKLRDKFLSCVIGYIRELYFDNKTRRQIEDMLNNACSSAAKLCRAGEREILHESCSAASGLVNSLADICHSFGFEAENIVVNTFDEN